METALMYGDNFFGLYELVSVHLGKPFVRIGLAFHQHVLLIFMYTFRDCAVRRAVIVVIEIQTEMTTHPFTMCVHIIPKKDSVAGVRRDSRRRSIWDAIWSRAIRCPSSGTFRGTDIDTNALRSTKACCAVCRTHEFHASRVSLLRAALRNRPTSIPPQSLIPFFCLIIILAGK